MSRGHARLAMGQGLAAWVLEAPDGFGDAGFHTHHAIQLTVSFRGLLTLETRREAITAPMVAVATDTEHRFIADGLLGFLFVAPESAAGRALSQQLLAGRGLAQIDAPAFAETVAPLRHAISGEMPVATMLATAQNAIDVLSGNTSPQLPDERVERIIARAFAHPGESLDQAAAGACVFLSPSRLRHLFVEHTGLPFKTYMLWQRLMRALECYASGGSLTEAAHAAGFADSAHFSRVFRRYFGLPASTLTRLTGPSD